MLNRNIKKIENIIVTEKQREMIKQYREIHPYFARSTEYMSFVRRDVKVDGLCCCCDEVPSKLVIYRSGFVERYCDKHLDRVKDNLDDVSQYVTIKQK